MARLPGQHFSAIHNLVLPGSGGKLINEGLDRKGRVRMADRPPHSVGTPTFTLWTETFDGIGEVADTFDHRGVDAILHKHLLERRSDNEGLACDHMLPGHHCAPAVNACSHAMREDGTVAAATDVVLAAPNHLDRPLVHSCLHDMRRFGRHLGCRRRPPAEASAREHRFDLDLFRLQPQYSRGHRLVQRLRWQP